MKKFDITARDLSGKLVKMTWEGPSAGHMRQMAQSKNLLVTHVIEQSQPLSAHLFKRRISPKSILLLLREIGTIVGAGVPVTEALVMVQDRPDDPSLTTTLHEINEDIKRGKPLAEAFSLHPEVFEPALVTTFQIGMSSGELGPALARYQRDLSMRVELSRKFRKVMIYPLFLLGLLALVLVVLFIFILPNFVDLYAEFDAELPRPTQILIRMVETAPIWFTMAMGLWLGAWLTHRFAKQTFRGKRWLDRISFKIPIFGKLKNESQMAQIASSLSLLLQAGMPLKSAVNLVRSNFSDTFLIDQLAQIEIGLSSGKRFSELTKQNGLFLGPSQGLIEAGERTGALDQMLEQVAKLHEDVLNERVDFVTALVEPIMMVLVGGVIGIIVITVYLPIFGVTNVIE